MSTSVKTRAEGFPSAARQGGHVEEMQRRRLLSALAEVLAEQGLENASIGRICKRAGVSRRTFYELFDDRDECLLDAFGDAVEHLSRPVLAVWEGSGSWRDRVRDSLGVLFEQLDADPDLARLCVIETLKAGPIVSERRASVLATLVDAVEQGRREAPRDSEPPPLAGQGVVGGALSVIHTRLMECPPRVIDGPRTGKRPSSYRSPALSNLTGALMAMIVHPYLGSAAASSELERPVPKAADRSDSALKDPFKDLPIRFTYRTARVLATIAAESERGSYPSNRLIAEVSGVTDEGQMSRLLARLLRAGLIENQGDGHAKGEANAWALTERGRAVHVALTGR